VTRDLARPAHDLPRPPSSSRASAFRTSLSSQPRIFSVRWPWRRVCPLAPKGSLGRCPPAAPPAPSYPQLTVVSPATGAPGACSPGARPRRSVACGGANQNCLIWARTARIRQGSGGRHAVLTPRDQRKPAACAHPRRQVGLAAPWHATSAARRTDPMGRFGFADQPWSADCVPLGRRAI